MSQLLHAMSHLGEVGWPICGDRVPVGVDEGPEMPTAWHVLCMGTPASTD